jgi:hypothetical protein
VYDGAEEEQLEHVQQVVSEALACPQITQLQAQLFVQRRTAE